MPFPGAGSASILLEVWGKVVCPHPGKSTDKGFYTPGAWNETKT
jgi:hypothetical protein